MRLLRLQMRGSAQEMTSSFIFGDVMVRNRIFWTIGEQLYMVYYTIISYRKIKVYRFETMDMERSHWNNGVSGTILISISSMLLIEQDKRLW